MNYETINLAVITGAKAHDVINFHKLFRNFNRINSYIQHIDDFAASPEAVRDYYDAVLFFFMMPDCPTDEGLPGYRGQPKTALERLGKTGQGIVVLHHALLAYPQWSVWDEIVGITNRQLSQYQHDETLYIRVADMKHPITQDLSGWTMVDETYLMADASGGSHILLTTRHDQSMETIAWTHSYQQSRVFCLQSGHDQQTWSDEHFRLVLERGIKWSCRKHSSTNQ